MSNDTIDSIIVTLSALGVEHKISHGVVRVPVEVSIYVVGSLVLGHVDVTLVSLKLMGVHKVVAELKDSVLEPGGPLH